MKNNKYPIKVAAIRKIESGQSKNSICKELGVCLRSLELWYAQYLSGGELALLKDNSGHRRSFEEKIAVIKEVQDNGLSLPDASRKYLVPEYTITRWLIAYREKGEDGLMQKSMAKKKAHTQEQLDELEILRRRNEYLEAENALLKKVKALVEEREARLRATGRKPSKD